MISLLSEKGASSWLSALPVEERDALFLRYGWLPSGLPVHCACGQGFSIDHALNCPTAGGILHLGTMNYVILQLSFYQRCVLMFALHEPLLQPLSGETLTYAAANVGRWCSFGYFCSWVLGQSAPPKSIFDVKVFNLNVSSYRGSQVSSLYRRFEKDKRRRYEQRIREVEMASFTPLVLSTSGGMSGCTNVFYKRLAYLLSLKKLEYGNVMAWLRCHLSFSLLRSAIACLRGARSHRGCPANYGALDLALIGGLVCDHAT